MGHRILIIVDPQNDFIDGSLAVEGASEAMSELAKYLHENKDKYDAIIITLDWHPADHCSFAEKGGMWPQHCIQFSHGASIYPQIDEEMNSYEGNFLFLTKGEDSTKEAYSVFEDEENAEDFDRFISTFSNPSFDFCGIAADYCVFNTMKDFIKRHGSENVSLLNAYTPFITIQGNDEFMSFIEKNSVSVI